MDTLGISLILLVQCVSSQSPDPRADPLGDLNIDALLAELGGGAPPPDPRTSPGHLAGVSAQTGGGNALDLEAAINDIQNELRQTLAADSGLQGLVAGGPGDLGNLEALLGSLGGSGGSSTATNARSTADGSASPRNRPGDTQSPSSQSFLTPDPRLHGLTGLNKHIGNPNAVLGSFEGTGSPGSRSESNSGVGVERSRLSNAVSSISSKMSLGGESTSSKIPSFSSQPVASQNNLEKFSIETHNQHKDGLLEMSLPKINELSINPPSSSPSKRDSSSLNSFVQLNPLESFTQIAGPAPQSSVVSTQTRNTNTAPFSSAAFSQGSHSVSTQFADLKIPDSTFDFPSTFQKRSSVFSQSSSPVVDIADSSRVFEATQTSSQSASPSRSQLQNLSPDELRRALAEVNKEIDKLSGQIKTGTQLPGLEGTKIRNVESRIPPGLNDRSSSLIGLEPGSIAQRFGAGQGLESSSVQETSAGNSFELAQTPLSHTGLQPSSPDSTVQQQTGPEGQQFVTAVPPQINPLSAMESVGAGLPFAQNPFVPRFSPMFGAPMIGQMSPMLRSTPQGLFLQNPGQLPPTLGQVTPEIANQRQRFGNTNSVEFGDISVPGSLRSSLPNLRFEPPNASQIRNNEGSLGRDLQLDVRRQPETTFSPGFLRGRFQHSRQEPMSSLDRFNRARSGDRTVDRIRDSVRQQRSRSQFDTQSLRHGRGGVNGVFLEDRVLRLSGVNIRRHSGPNRPPPVRMSARQPGSLRFRSSWRGRL